MSNKNRKKRQKWHTHYAQNDNARYLMQLEELADKCERVAAMMELKDELIRDLDDVLDRLRADARKAWHELSECQETNAVHVDISKRLATLCGVASNLNL